MELLVSHIGQVQRTITLHLLDHNPVAFASKRDLAIALDNEGDRILWRIDDASQLKISIDLDVGITMAANQQVILAYITLEYQGYLLLSSLCRLLHIAYLTQATPVMLKLLLTN